MYGTSESTSTNCPPSSPTVTGSIYFIYFFTGISINRSGEDNKTDASNLRVNKWMGLGKGTISAREMAKKEREGGGERVRGREGG